jgi:hypothetical protein
MNKLTKFIAALMMVLVIAVPVVALAQAIVLPADPGLPGTPNSDLAGSLLRIIQQWLLPFAGIIAVLFIIIGGFQYMFAGMNEKLVERGKSTLRNAIVGLVIIILSYVIITVVVNTVFRFGP